MHAPVPLYSDPLRNQSSNGGIARAQLSTWPELVPDLPGVLDVPQLSLLPGNGSLYC